MELKIIISKVVGIFIATFFILTVHFILALTKAIVMLAVLGFVVFTIFNFLLLFFKIIIYKLVVIFYRIKTKIYIFHVYLLYFYYRIISRWFKKDSLMKYFKINYRSNHECLASYKIIMEKLLKREEEIMRKYQDEIDSGIYTKYDLSNIIKEYNEDIKKVQKSIKHFSAEINRLEKECQDSSTNLN